jgi:hypothetical protein
MLPCVTEVELEEGLGRLVKAGVRKLMTDRYNARGMIINHTLKAYKAWNPHCDAEGIRELLWVGDEYYRQLDAKISDLWKRMIPNATYERDLDWYRHKKRSGKSTPNS